MASSSMGRNTRSTSNHYDLYVGCVFGGFYSAQHSRSI